MQEQTVRTTNPAALGETLSVRFAVMLHACVFAFAYAFNAIHEGIAESLTIGACFISVMILLVSLASLQRKSEHRDLFWASFWMIVNTALIASVAQQYLFPVAEPGVFACIAAVSVACVVTNLLIATFKQRPQREAE